jgi:hypothetical protein
VRKNSQRDFDKWKKLTSTTGISRQTSKISQSLITDAFVERFNNELKNLGSQKIKVAIEKRTTKGRVLHKIVFTGVKRKISSRLYDLQDLSKSDLQRLPDSDGGYLRDGSARRSSSASSPIIRNAESTSEACFDHL